MSEAQTFTTATNEEERREECGGKERTVIFCVSRDNKSRPSSASQGYANGCSGQFVFHLVTFSFPVRPILSIPSLPFFLPPSPSLTSTGTKQWALQQQKTEFQYYSLSEEPQYGPPFITLINPHYWVLRHSLNFIR